MSTPPQAWRPNGGLLADPLDLESRLSRDAHEEGAERSAVDHDLVALPRLEAELGVIHLSPGRSVGKLDRPSQISILRGAYDGARNLLHLVAGAAEQAT